MIEFENQSEHEVIDVMSEIEIKYSYNRHPRRGYHCAYTEGMEKFGSPELCLMDYYSPEESEYILYNMADCVLNGDLFDPESGTYDFFGIVELANENDEIEYRFGFIGGDLYDQQVMCLQLIDIDGYPVHPGEDFLPSYTKRGFEPWPLFMYVDDDGIEEVVE